MRSIAEKDVPRRHKAPDETRRRLLESAYREIHRTGYQAASLTAILRSAGVTKGALYHHFDDKLALGLAVLDEVVAPSLRRIWIEPLCAPDIDPIDTLIRLVREAGAAMTLDDILIGCPLNNLAQEMSPIEERFRTRIDAIYGEWREVIRAALARGQDHGRVVAGLDPVSAAAFIVATLEGCMGAAKNAQSRDLLTQCGKGLIYYLESLRPRSRVR